MPDNPYQLSGNLPFQAGGNPFGGDISGAYQSSYNSALAQNQALYGNILQGYNQTMNNQVQGQQGIQQGYGALKSEVLGDIQGITASQQQAIQDVYAQQQGQMQQGMINRGLGNTTVMDSMSRGLTLDEQKASIALANQQAQLTAGYASQLGSAGLAYQNQALMQNTGEANQALGWMNSVSAQYPNAQSYAQLQYNQGLQNALKGNAGMNPPGLGGYSVGGSQAPPIAPYSQSPPANPFDYGGGGGGGDQIYGPGGGGFTGPGGDQSFSPAGGGGYDQSTAQWDAMGPSPGYDTQPSGDYAGTAADYMTDPNSYSSDPYAGYNLGTMDYGDTSYA